MACTKQSAKEYIENARKHLIGRLKDLSLIVENLRQRGVLKEEEVSEIQAGCNDFEKTRNILDWVTCHGEAASYELLKIFYSTREKTLERPLERTGPASSQDSVQFDSHHWISCFSFKETDLQTNYLLGSRPCYRYQAQLKSQAQRISKNAWEQDGLMFQNRNSAALSYSPLVLDTHENSTLSKIKTKNKKCKKPRPKKLNTYIPVDKQETSPNALLSSPENKVLLVGKPGIGKTTVTHQMLKLWAEKDTEELDYMFYFDMRDPLLMTNSKTLESLLFMNCKPTKEKEEVLLDIEENSGKVTIIFDGMTDLSFHPVIKKLVKKELLSDAKIVITCRPEVESEDFLTEWSTLRVEVKGFSDQSIREYLTKMLSAEPDSLSSVLTNLELFSLCHVPMYALAVVAGISFHPSEMTEGPGTLTKMYVNILRNCIQKHSDKPISSNLQLNNRISEESKKILSLAEIAFEATGNKTVDLTTLGYEESNAFLGTFMKQVNSREWEPRSNAFLHYTMQEFFAALWLLQNPDRITQVLQDCLTDEKKHMKHLVPFLCGLLNAKSVKCLIPVQQMKTTAGWFFKEMVNTFLPPQTNQDDDSCDLQPQMDLQFLCQCLYESQSTEACLLLLEKLDYHLDLSGEHLDAHCCCAVSYVINQSRERKVGLDLEDSTVSDQGIRVLLGCLQNVQSLGADPSLLCHLWTTLLYEREMDFISLLDHCRNELHLPALGKQRVFERAGEVMKQSPERVNLFLHWDHRTPLSEDLSRTILKCLPHINTLRFSTSHEKSEEKKQKGLLLHLCLQVETYQREMFLSALNRLLSLFSVYHTEKYDVLLDLYSHVRGIKSLRGRSFLLALKPIYQSAPAVWSIDLSQRKASLLLEVLKLQPEEKKDLELKGWSDDESELRSFLQCLPYISQLRFTSPQDHSTFLLNLCLQAAANETGTIQTTMEKLLSLTDVYHDQKHDFILDLWSHVKHYETQTGRSVLPALQPVYQSAPPVWSIDLSKRKASLLLEVLKLQPEKKPVKLKGWSDEESEVRSFLQCLPYISQLSFYRWLPDSPKIIKFLVDLLLQAAEWEEQTGEKILKLLSSVCSYTTFPFQDDDEDHQCDFLLDLYSHVKDCETQTGRSLLPALQPVYQSAAPPVWSINLSERKTSLLLEVLKLQPEKKPVLLWGWSDEESEVRSFLQCLPYISQLSFTQQLSERSKKIKVLVDLLLQAAEWEEQTGEKTLKLLSSVCSYTTFPFHGRNYEIPFHGRNDEIYQCDFLLDLYSHVKDCETQTGRSLLPALQPVYQSAAPPVWSINLSKRKTSLLLEVLKLQPEKKPVELKGWSDEESEVRSFLQCLPYISQLSFTQQLSERSKKIKVLVDLLLQAAEWEEQTGEKTLKLLSSVCSYTTFPFHGRNDEIYQCDFLLDLYSHVKDCETQTGRSLLPALQPVYQSAAPPVWSINLSERKTSLLLEVLKLQPEKKPVELRGWSDEESELRSFLQCLPFISQLSFSRWQFDSPKIIKFLVDLLLQAAEWEEQTGEKTLKLLSSVCSYTTFPFHGRIDAIYQCGFLLNLYSHVKDCETQTGRSFLPALQPVYQSVAPPVWSIDLSERKTSLLLEVLKLQPEKKPVELKGWSDEESEVRSFLQCLPYISQLSFTQQLPEHSKQIKFLVDLLLQAAEWEEQTGEKTLKLLSSVCSYTTFPFHGRNDEIYQCAFLLDLCSRVKYYETQTGRNLLPALQPVYQSAPPVWSINLSKRKTSLLLEVLKLQPEKKPVELWGWSDEESEVRSFLQCLPFISQLSFYWWQFDSPKIIKFLVDLLLQAAEWEEQTGEKTLKLLSSVCSYRTFPLYGTIISSIYQCGFLLDLCSRVKDYETQTGRSFLPALQPVYQSAAPPVWSIDLSERKTSLLLEVLKLQPEKKPVKLKGWSDEESEVRSFLQCLPYISQLRLNETMAVNLPRRVRTGRVVAPVVIEELSLVLERTWLSEAALSRVVSSVASLLRLWSVQSLDLTAFSVHPHSLITLLGHHGPLTLRLCSEAVQQLAVVVCEAQDEKLTQLFLEKLGGDLTSCSLDWEVLLYFLQQSTLNNPRRLWNNPFLVDLRKNKLSEKNTSDLLPFLDRVVIKRPSTSFVMSAIRDVYESRSSDRVSSLLRSLDQVINLNTRELNTVDCAALRFTLQHSHRVRLHLLWASTPPGEIESILPLLHRVSHLSVDRKLLLRFLHCCAASPGQQGAAVSAELLRALQLRLDLSCSSSVDLSAQQQGETLCVSVGDCRAVSRVLRDSPHTPQLILTDCELEDAALRELLPILEVVKLSTSKALLLQLIKECSSGDSAPCYTESLCRALGWELDLSETRLDGSGCRSLALLLEHSEGLSDLDLSHCQLTDQHLDILLTHLHKAQVLDLSNNDITDALSDRILQVVSINTSIRTVRLFNNRIQDRRPFLTDKRFEIWSTNQKPA